GTGGEVLEVSGWSPSLLLSLVIENRKVKRDLGSYVEAEEDLKGTVFALAFEGMKHVKSEEGEMLSMPFLDVCKQILPVIVLYTFTIGVDLDLSCILEAKRRRQKELRREREAIKQKASVEKAEAKNFAKESMKLIQDERLELLELATSSKGQDSRLLGEVHIALLKLIIKDIKDVARTPSGGPETNQYTVANPESGHPCLKYFGFGPQLKKDKVKRFSLPEMDGVHRIFFLPPFLIVIVGKFKSMLKTYKGALIDDVPCIFKVVFQCTLEGRVSVTDMTGSELMPSKSDGSSKSRDSLFDLVNVLKHKI
nr:homeobox-DDT domain protein RLT1-like isoform X2 [Tanacetum cinerariifolium]